MALDYDFDSMTLDELKALRKEVNTAIESFEGRRKQEAHAKLEAVAREMGFSNLNDLIGNGKKSRTKPTPKYRHPDDTTKTWSGRGRRPKWLDQELANGKSIEDFKI